VNENRPTPQGPPGANGAGDTGNPSSSQKPFSPFADPRPQSGHRQYLPPAVTAPRPAAPPPAVRLDRIVSLPRANVIGEVVRGNEQADPGARLTFKRIDASSESHSVTADRTGRFRATLASGVWEVYTEAADGTLTPHTRIQVYPDQTKQMRLTSR
jgi:hypothetical protein